MQPSERLNEALRVAARVEERGYAVCEVENWNRVVAFCRDDEAAERLGGQYVTFTVAELAAIYAQSDKPWWAMIIEAKLASRAKVVRE